jgi:hypothetical protein
MKKFTFKLDKGNNSINRNAENDLSSFVANNIINKYPFIAGIDLNREDNIFGRNSFNKCDVCPFNNTCIYNNVHRAPKINGSDNMYIYLKDGEWYTGRDDYDFLWDGVPVKIHNDYVQVGYDIVPRSYFPTDIYFNGNPRMINRTVIEIIIKIKKHSSLF